MYQFNENKTIKIKILNLNKNKTLIRFKNYNMYWYINAIICTLFSIQYIQHIYYICVIMYACKQYTYFNYTVVCTLYNAQYTAYGGGLQMRGTHL